MGSRRERRRLRDDEREEKDRQRDEEPGAAVEASVDRALERARPRPSALGCRRGGRHTPAQSMTVFGRAFSRGNVCGLEPRRGRERRPRRQQRPAVVEIARFETANLRKRKEARQMREVAGGGHGEARGSRRAGRSVYASPLVLSTSRWPGSCSAGSPSFRRLSEEDVADLKLALTEAVSNSVRHAYAGGDGFVSVAYELSATALQIEVVDDGAGFDPAVPARLEGEELSEGGLGIAIIRTIADELEITSRPGERGSRLRFVKRLQPAA